GTARLPVAGKGFGEDLTNQLTANSSCFTPPTLLRVCSCHVPIALPCCRGIETDDGCHIEPDFSVPRGSPGILFLSGRRDRGSFRVSLFAFVRPATPPVWISRVCLCSR